jgi:hypothetical protein
MAVLVLGFIFISKDFSLSGFYTTSLLDGKLKIFNFSLNFKEPDIFLLAILNGVFGSLASFGTDYEMMQRLLTLKTRAQSQKTMAYTIIATLVLVILYLTLGTSIYIFLKANSIKYLDNSDKIVSYFAVNFLPHGFRGFVFLTVFLASIDLPLVSLSTSFVNDIYLKFKNIGEQEKIKVTRLAMLFFAILLSVIAIVSQKVEGMLWFAFEINGITSGSLLGVFLLGIFTNYHGNKIIIFSMIFSSLLCLSFMILNRIQITNVPWSSFVVIGTIISFFFPQIISKITLKKYL